MTPRQRLSPPPPEDRSLSPVLQRKTVEREDSGASTSVEADSSRDRHDLFNLVALVSIDQFDGLARHKYNTCTFDYGLTL